MIITFALNLSVTILGPVAHKEYEYSNIFISKGDFDADGRQDLVVGVSDADGPGGYRTDCGEVYIIFGKNLSPGANVDLKSLKPDYIVFGPGKEDNLSIVLTGDFDGDGRSDLVVGCPGYDLKNREDCGAVFIIKGKRIKSGGSFDLAIQEPDFSVVGADRNDAIAPAAVGDLDGDGKSDLIVSSAYADGPFNEIRDCGETYIFFGKDMLPGGFKDLSKNTPGFHIYGVDAEDMLGGSGVSCGDIDGDGKDDIALFAPGGDGPDNSRKNCGDVYVIYASSVEPGTSKKVDEIADFIVYGKEKNWALVSQSRPAILLEDLNGDKKCELIAGFPGADGPAGERNNCGEVCVFFSLTITSNNIYDLSQMKADFTVYGADSGDRTGSSLAAGDVDADGFKDLVVGVPYASGAENKLDKAGEVYLISGKNISKGSFIDLVRQQPGFYYSGEKDLDYLGYPICFLDSNKDKKYEMVVGAIGADHPDGNRLNCGKLLVFFP